MKAEFNGAWSLESIEAWIRAWLNTRRNTDLSDLSREEDLVANGVIDSLGMIELIATVEAEYNIELGAADLQRADFVTLRGLAAAVSRNLEAQA